MLSSSWQISDQAVANSVADEVVILHLGNGNYFGLDAIGAYLWNGLTADRSVAEIFDDILENYDVDRERLEQDLSELLTSMVENELISQG